VKFLTDFADQAVILPLALAIAVALLAQRWRRGAVAWLLTVVATLGVTLVLKLVFEACYRSFDLLDLQTPSGHVAAAAVVSGGLASLLTGRRRAAVLLAVFVAVLIAVSRLVLGTHSLPEVAVGAAIGLAGAMLVPRLAGAPPAGLDVRRVALIALAVLTGLHGLHMHAEAHIRSTASFLAEYFGVCRTDRALW
jgi:membrane-associated phospholipid phosphatase